VGFDRSCLDGSDWCVWSCAVGAESGTGDSPYPYCEEGKFRCPTGAKKLSSCPARSCARFDAYCCDSSTGKIVRPVCQADGLRDTVCPDGSDVSPFARCVPAGVSVVSSCGELDGKRCETFLEECNLGAACRCVSVGDGALAWLCESVIP